VILGCVLHNLPRSIYSWHNQNAVMLFVYACVHYDHCKAMSEPWASYGL
jgi:hypothetical protein